ncbi:hypothetical protein VNO80_09803 [Phaseolus coccineus]|uniref:Pentatricopeptide repeat-containing protein n=1 Tax=Phaseolus coccineus TaxID=3886 RepID=A0AAN9N6V3_PHACN
MLKPKCTSTMMDDHLPPLKRTVRALPPVETMSSSSNDLSNSLSLPPWCGIFPSLQSCNRASLSPRGATAADNVEDQAAEHAEVPACEGRWLGEKRVEVTAPHRSTTSSTSRPVCMTTTRYRPLVGRMQSLRYGPTHRTFTILGKRYAANGKPHRAVRTFLSMLEHNCCQDLNSFNIVLDVLYKSKCMEMTHTLVKTFKSRFRLDSVSYNIITNGYCLIKHMSMVLQVLKEMVQRGINLTMVTYNTLLKGGGSLGDGEEGVVCVEDGDVGEVDKGLEMFGKMKNEPCFPNLDMPIHA